MTDADFQKRILLVTWDYGEWGGGLGRLMQWIAQALRRDGYSVTVASPFPDADIRLSSVTAFRGGHILFSCLLPFILPRLIRRLGITDLILPVGPGGVFLIRRPTHCRVHAIVDHLYAQQCSVVPGERWKRMFLPLERRTIATAHRLFCVSPDTAHALRSFYDTDAGVLIPYGFESCKEERKDPQHCLCVASLTARKGVDLLLRAWTQVIESQPDARLTLIGDGPKKHLLDQLPTHVRASIDWIRHLPHADVLALCDQAAIVICPSYLEGFSLACSEAMNRGAVPVVCDSDGLRFLVEDGTGIMVPQGDAAALSAAVIGLLRDPSGTRVTGESARRSIRSRFGTESARSVLAHTLGTAIRTRP